VTGPKQTTIVISTRGRALVDVTERVRAAVRASGVQVGLCSIFLQHTSASLVIQENADPSVLRDLERFLDRLAPENARYEHDAEGPDDMPAHIKSAVTKTSELVPITGGELALGTWQAIYVWEHRHAPHERRLVVTVLGA
jgi:secondary thiamine-phosphate synthase enzyme